MGISEVFNTYLGQGNVGDTSENNGQCVGLVSVWADALGAPHDWGNAKDLFANADASFYDKIQNAPDNFPILGDILVWDHNFGNGFGHTGIVVAANVYHVSSFDQNWTPNAPCLFVNHNYDHVIGWLRSKHGI